MYPTIEIFGIQIYTFGFFLSCSWLLFFVLLHRLSSKNGIVRPIFQDIFSFTLSIFFFSRLFHIFTDWVNEKFILIELVNGNIIQFLKYFFIPADFLFSLFGAFVGFFLVFFIKTRFQKSDRTRYLEAIMGAFLGASLLGYLGAFLGGQIYGIPWDSWISVTYDHPDSIVEERSALFPLAIFYIIMTTGIITIIRKFGTRFHLPDGYSGYIGLGLFSVMIFFGEFLSGKRKEMFYDFTAGLTHNIFGMSLSQIGALLGIIISIVCILRLTEKKS